MDRTDAHAGHLHRTKTRPETQPIRNHLGWAEAVILVDRGSFVGGWGLLCGWAGKVVHPSIQSTPPLNEKGSFRVAPN